MTDVFYLGVVLADEPLSVEAAGVILDAKDLFVSARLQKTYKRKIVLKEIKTLPIDVSELTATAEAEEFALKPGDEVILCALSGAQQFVILDKVEAAK